MRKNPRRNLTRIDTTTRRGTRFRGWEVRIQRRGERYHRFFNDAKWGGNRSALRAAQAFRDEIESQTRFYRVAELAKRPSVRNRSGLVGVRREPPRGAAKDSAARPAAWIAQWTDGHGKRKTRVFSVAKFGEKAARQMAKRARSWGVRRSGR